MMKRYIDWFNKLYPVWLVNGGMAAWLAREHFALMPLAAAAGVFSGVMQNIIGGLLASWWKRQPPEA